MKNNVITTPRLRQRWKETERKSLQKKRNKTKRWQTDRPIKLFKVTLDHPSNQTNEINRKKISIKQINWFRFRVDRWKLKWLSSAYNMLCVWVSVQIKMLRSRTVWILCTLHKQFETEVQRKKTDRSGQ